MDNSNEKIDRSAEMKSPGRNLWPLAIIGSLAVVFFVNAFVLYMSVATDDGLVNEDYYMKGLFYDEGLKGAKELGWEIDLTIDRTARLSADEPTPLRVAIVKGGLGVTDALVVVTLKRPATDRYDREFALTAASGGGYTGELVIPVDGFWDIEVRAGRDGLEMAKTFRIEV